MLAHEMSTPKGLSAAAHTWCIQDYVEIMGGLDSPGFAHFKKLFKEGFEAARKHSDSIISKCHSFMSSYP